MDFLKISVKDARIIATDSNEEYTPGYDSRGDYYFYKEIYTPDEQSSVYTLNKLQMDGLTPINPTKPMFPKK